MCGRYFCWRELQFIGMPIFSDYGPIKIVFLNDCAIYTKIFGFFCNFHDIDNSILQAYNVRSY